MQERELVSYLKNNRGETLVKWCSPTEDGVCTLEVWLTARWKKWEPHESDESRVSLK
jgi:hypothetical protein